MTPLLLNPQWLCGFVDGCGSFHIKKRLIGKKIDYQPEFSITHHRSGVQLLSAIRTLLGTGTVSPQSANNWQYCVRELPLLKSYIIPFFEAYPLLTNKRYEYEEWRYAVLELFQAQKFNEQQSHSWEGLAAENNEEKWQLHQQSNLIFSQKPTLPTPWVVGFCDAQSEFSVNISSFSQIIFGYTTNVEFSIRQNYFASCILDELQTFFGCGEVYNDTLNPTRSKLRIRSNPAITSIIVPFFEKNNFQTDKKFDFLRFRKVMHMINKREHMKVEGIQKILQIWPSAKEC